MPSFFFLLLVDLSVWNQKLEEATPPSGLHSPTEDDDELSSDDDLDSDQFPSITPGVRMEPVCLSCIIQLALFKRTALHWSNVIGVRKVFSQ